MQRSHSSVHLAVVVPAYNEERRLLATIGQLREFLVSREWSWEIRVVDDGSTDGTARVVSSLQSEDPRIVLQREPHRGKGGAVRAGLLAASSQYCFICDADLSMPVHELPRFLPPSLADFDVAIGTREGLGARRVGEPLSRHLAGRAFNTLVRWLMVPGIQDTQCGFKMFTAAAVDAIFPHVTVEGWAFDIEALFIARRRGLRIREVPIEWHYRRESHVRMLRDGAGMFGELLRMRIRARRGKYDLPAGRPR
ncbi:glycosyltransferase family 2 protein [soil metagenome]